MWILIAILFLLFATAMVLLPFFRPEAPLQPDEVVDRQLLALYTKRDQLYQAIREAKFDKDTGKLSPEDYERQATRLKRQAANVLKAIDRREDNLVSSELNARIEALVRAERQEQASLRPVAVTSASRKSGETVRYCTKCGTRLNVGDRFCPACGTRMP